MYFQRIGNGSRGRSAVELHFEQRQIGTSPGSVRGTVTAGRHRAGSAPAARSASGSNLQRATAAAALHLPPTADSFRAIRAVLRRRACGVMTMPAPVLRPGPGRGVSDTIPSPSASGCSGTPSERPPHLPEPLDRIMSCGTPRGTAAAARGPLETPDTPRAFGPVRHRHQQLASRNGRCDLTAI